MSLLLLLLLLAPADLAGRWTLVEGDAAAAPDAVERTLESMPALMRPLARKRMHESIQAVRVYEITLDGDVLRVGKDGGDGRPVYLDGAPRRETGADSKEAEVRAEVRADSVEHRWTRDDSRGSTRYAIDGETLRVTRTIDSRWFGEPVVFTTRYRR